MERGILENLVNSWGNRPKIYVVAAGCGWAFARLLEVPGASKVVDEIRLLYSKESWLDLVSEITQDHDGNFKFVSQQGLDYLFINCPTNRNTINIALTASLPSNYAKRSQNQVFGRVNKETFHIVFPNDMTREQSDIAIMERVCSILRDTYGITKI